jgi:hypothetical protein
MDVEGCPSSATNADESPQRRGTTHSSTHETQLPLSNAGVDAREGLYAKSLEALRAGAEPTAVEPELVNDVGLY